MNPNVEDRTTPPSLLPRSIALVRLELSGSKVASTAKEHVFFVCANATSVRSGKGNNFTSARVQIITKTTSSSGRNSKSAAKTMEPLVASSIITITDGNMLGAHPWTLCFDLHWKTLRRPSNAVMQCRRCSKVWTAMACRTVDGQTVTSCMAHIPVTVPAAFKRNEPDASPVVYDFVSRRNSRETSRKQWTC